MAGKAPREPLVPRTPRSRAPPRGMHPCVASGMAGGFLGPKASPCFSSEADEVWSSHFARLTAARPCSLPASQEGLWGEGDEDPVPAEPRGFTGPPGAQPQPGPLVQTCLLRDLEMGPLAQTQTLRDFEQVRPRGAGTPPMASPGPSGHCRVLAAFMPGPLDTTEGCGVQEGSQAGGGGKGRGGLSPAGRHAPLTALTAAARGGLRGSGFTTRCPRSSDSSNSSGRRKKRGKGEQRGQRRELRAGREPRLCPGGAM